MKLKEAIEQLRRGLVGVAEPQEVQAMIRVICEDVGPRLSNSLTSLWMRTRPVTCGYSIWELVAVALPFLWRVH